MSLQLCCFSRQVNYIFPLLFSFGIKVHCGEIWLYFSSIGSLAIAREGELTIGTIDDIQKLHIRTIPIGEHARRICHQEQTRTFAISCLRNEPSAEESESHFVRLLDAQSFEFLSSYPLDAFECGCSILSCSFTDDKNVYYCVGTAYVLPEENEPTKVSFQ